MTAADQSTLLPAIEQPKSSVSVYCGGAYHAQYLSKTRKKKRCRSVSLYLSGNPMFERRLSKELGVS